MSLAVVLGFLQAARQKDFSYKSMAVVRSGARFGLQQADGKS